MFLSQISTYLSIFKNGLIALFVPQVSQIVQFWSLGFQLHNLAPQGITIASPVFH